MPHPATLGRYRYERIIAYATQNANAPIRRADNRHASPEPRALNPRNRNDRSCWEVT